MDVCYLDHNATTPIRPEAETAVLDALRRCGNPSSVHRAGRHARQTVEAAREAIAALVGAPPDSVILTSGGTEANNLAVRGCRRPVVAAATEHASVLSAIGGLRTLPVTERGLVDTDILEAWLAAADEPPLVSVMLANNETGVIQPVRVVADIAHRYGAIVHCDAVQAAGKMQVDVGELGVDLLSLSAHKLGGPAGVGALVVKGDVPLEAMLRGGGQERSRRAGTENLAGIAGFGAAAAIGANRTDWRRIDRLRQGIEDGVRRVCPTAGIIGEEAPRLPNTSCIAMPGVNSAVQVIRFDLAGIAVSAGSACSSGSVRDSHVLAAMGVGSEIARTAVRVSLGWTSREEDMNRFLDVWTDIFLKARASRPAEASAPKTSAAEERMS
jgi:cysteine desulfurase